MAYRLYITYNYGLSKIDILKTHQVTAYAVIKKLIIHNDNFGPNTISVPNLLLHRVTKIRNPKPFENINYIIFTRLKAFWI